MESIFNYKVSEIKPYVKERKNWGSYFVIDDFIEKAFFKKLCIDYNKIKKNRAIFSQKTIANVWREEEPKGLNLMFGGAGANIEAFEKITSISEEWDYFLKKIYSSNFFEYIKEIFKETQAFKEHISLNDLIKGKIGCKLSSQTNNYGDRIHQDTTTKVISFLLYLGNEGWHANSAGGTDLWEVKKDFVPYDKDNNSIDSKLRQGKDSPQSHSLKHSESKKIKKFLSIDFQPNRFIGFVRTPCSYHSVPPRCLPQNITRDCFQINIWNFNRKSSYSKTQKIINFSKAIFRRK